MHLPNQIWVKYILYINFNFSNIVWYLAFNIKLKKKKVTCIDAIHEILLVPPKCEIILAFLLKLYFFKAIALLNSSLFLPILLSLFQLCEILSLLYLFDHFSISYLHLVGAWLLSQFDSKYYDSDIYSSFSLFKTIAKYKGIHFAPLSEKERQLLH